MSIPCFYKTLLVLNYEDAGEQPSDFRKSLGNSLHIMLSCFFFCLFLFVYFNFADCCIDIATPGFSAFSVETINYTFCHCIRHTGHKHLKNDAINGLCLKSL